MHSLNKALRSGAICSMCLYPALPNFSLCFLPQSLTVPLLNEKRKVKKKGLCHSNPLKHPRETEAVWLGPLCDTTPQLQNIRQTRWQKTDLYPNIHNLSYVLPAVLSTGHYLLPCTVISGLSRYLKSTNKGAQTQLTFLVKVLTNAVFIRVKNPASKFFIIYSFNYL